MDFSQAYKSTRKKKPYWRTSEKWVCPNHFPAAVLPKSIQRCWYSNCTMIRPLLPTNLVIHKDLNIVKRCAWFKCSSKKPALPNRKYCSDECRKKRARYNYVLKKKKEKNKNKQSN